MEKISVIIPTHNRADILPRAIKSIQNQTRSVDEIIVVSDGSTDNTDEVVKEFAAKDDRIQLIEYHPGHNGNYARNKGLEAATGQFIAFLDDDDEWLPRKTELQTSDRATEIVRLSCHPDQNPVRPVPRMNGVTPQQLQKASFFTDIPNPSGISRTGSAKLIFYREQSEVNRLLFFLLLSVCDFLIRKYLMDSIY